MKIAIISKLWEETTPFSSGGTGASIGALVNGLVDKGHELTLFATGNSKTKAQKLISVREKPYRDDYSEIHEYENIAEAFRRYKDFDIIHCAVEQKSVLFGDLVSTPSLHSIRYGEFFDHELKLLKKYKNLNFVCNSKAIKKLLPFLNWKGFVYNGISLDDFSYSDKKGDYFLFLGRLSEQKGVDIAIKLARKLNKKLVLAGKLVERDSEFTKKYIEPFINNKNIIYKGEVLGKKKIDLLKNAHCLIQPNRFFEACSNSILEALACGTPVVTVDIGSNKEIVKHGKTGFVVENERELLKAIKNIDKIDRKDCRESIEKNFSLEKMVEGYEKIYEKIINNN
ncbi:glycosyltransferase family 4 protein [bacterium]|nr:glycosyltransferase family 4 protein [bacterium]